nr:fatty acid desaturase [Palleronia aestuarii]
MPDQSISAGNPAWPWVRTLSGYRDARTWRSLFELVVTILPLALLWAAAWWALSLSAWLAVALSLLNAGFLVRLFAIQHDCGHGAFFNSRKANDWTGRCLGVLTLTPYAVWRRSHSIHHSTAGHLERRGIGDVHTMTVREYKSASARARLGYRIYRHPLVMLGLFPTLLFWGQNRFPGSLNAGWQFWASAMGTNAVLALLIGIFVSLIGIEAMLLVYLPTTIAAATIGVWLFYVQHQFEDTSWDAGEDWQLHEAALHGSSHYDLPPVLRWMTANIGIHHVHHLHSRIPFYRLPDVLRDHPQLAGTARITLRESIACLRLKLWDETGRKLVSFADAAAIRT